jgi:hypothetical protein
MVSSLSPASLWFTSNSQEIDNRLGAAFKRIVKLHERDDAIQECRAIIWQMVAEQERKGTLGQYPVGVIVTFAIRTRNQFYFTNRRWAGRGRTGNQYTADLYDVKHVESHGEFFDGAVRPLKPAADTNPFHDARQHIDLDEAVAKLPDNARQVFQKLSDGWTVKEIAAEMGVSDSRICQLRKLVGQALEAHGYGVAA